MDTTHRKRNSRDFYSFFDISNLDRPFDAAAVPVKYLGGVMQMAFAMLLFVTSTMAAFGQAVSEQPFTVSISTEKSTFKSGDPIPVKVELTNTSNKDLNVSSEVDLNSGVLFTHSFEVHNETGKLVPPRIHTHQQSQTGSAPPNPEQNPPAPETSTVIF